jgi:hypothetical protein
VPIASHRRAVDDRRRDEWESSGTSTTLTGMPAAPGCARDSGIERPILRCRVDQSLAFDVARLEGARHNEDGALFAERAQLVGDRLCDNQYARAGLAQPAHLLRRLLARCHGDQHVAAIQVRKRGNIACASWVLPSGKRRLQAAGMQVPDDLAGEARRVGGAPTHHGLQHVRGARRIVDS